MTSEQPSEEFFKAVVSQIREMLSDIKLRYGLLSAIWCVQICKQLVEKQINAAASSSQSIYWCTVGYFVFCIRYYLVSHHNTVYTVYHFTVWHPECETAEECAVECHMFCFKLVWGVPKKWYFLSTSINRPSTMLTSAFLQKSKLNLDNSYYKAVNWLLCLMS